MSDDTASVLARLVAMHFNTDGVIHRSSFEHVRVEALWEYARQVSEAAQSSSKFLPVAPSSAASVDLNLTDEEADSFVATVTSARATSGARAAGGDVPEMARELHTLLRNGKETPYADGEERRRYELIVTRWLEKLRPTPSAPGVAELLAECDKRLTYDPAPARMTCREIVRLLAPSGADGTEAGT